AAVSLLSPDESHLFVTNQQDGTISVFNVAPDGSLTELKVRAPDGSVIAAESSPFPTGSASSTFRGSPGGTPYLTSFPGHMATDPTGTFLITKNYFEITVHQIGPTGTLTPWSSSRAPGDIGVFGSLAAYPATQCTTTSSDEAPAIISPNATSFTVGS